MIFYIRYFTFMQKLPRSYILNSTLHIQPYERHRIVFKLYTTILLTADPGNREVKGQRRVYSRSW